jgi:hypothetical protein
MKIMFDSMIFDKLAAKPNLVDLLKGLVEDGAILVLTTHIQINELADIPDEEKRKKLSEIPLEITTEIVPTSGAIFGVSAYGYSTHGDARDAEISIDDVMAGSPNDVHDALISSTASVHADVLVTEDKGLTKKLKRLNHKSNLKVWDFDTLETFLTSP